MDIKTVPDASSLGDFFGRVIANLDSEALQERFRVADIMPEDFGRYLDRLVVEDRRNEQRGEERALLERYLLTPFQPSSDNRLVDLYDPNTDSKDEGRTVYVAAAGNYARDFPLYPAAYPNVIAASSYDCDPGCYVPGGFISSFSNFGQVAAPGASFDSPLELEDKSVIEGTSFAAPAVSVFLAARLASSASGGALVDDLLTQCKDANVHLTELGAQGSAVAPTQCSF